MITITLHTKLDDAYSASAVKNQASGLATGITTPILTDASDNTYVGLPPTASAPAGSISQERSIDMTPTSATVTARSIIEAAKEALENTGVRIGLSLLTLIISAVAIIVHRNKIKVYSIYR